MVEVERHVCVVEKLIGVRCNVDHQMGNGATPLYVAAKEGHTSVAKKLLAARCNVHLQTKNGRTALQVAQLHGHAGITTLILSRGEQQDTPLLGRLVVIDGLVAKSELNGCTGTAVSFDDDKGRYFVELGTSSFMIKPSNLLQVRDVYCDSM